MRPRKAHAILIPFSISTLAILSAVAAPSPSLAPTVRIRSTSFSPELKLLGRHGGHPDPQDANGVAEGTEDLAEVGWHVTAPSETFEGGKLDDNDDDDDDGSNPVDILQHHESHHLNHQETAKGTASHIHESGHDHHHSHAPPLLVLNESLILLTHAPDPPSYWDFDQTEDGKAGLLYVHIVLMTLGFFGLLPLAIFLKAGRSPLHVLAQAGFLVASISGLVFGQLYNTMTPDMYEGSSHGSWGWFTMLLTFALNAVDIARFFLRFTRWGKANRGSAAENFEEHAEKTEIDETTPFRLGEDQDDEDEVDRMAGSPSASSLEQPLSPSYTRSNSLALSEAETVVQRDESYWSGEHASTAPERSGLQRWASLALAAAERSLMLLAYVEVCSGVAVWTGTCRGNYLNGCLAHIIKGSIFLWYGLLTFARYCGAFSSLGWAWNRHPSKSGSIWTAEFVESLVIFVYGSTNTWMERMGKSGSPYSVKDVQHISIAIMFWAAGAIGMLLESRTVRSWLSTPAAQTSGRPLSSISPPASAGFSFNPFPALCIGVTGVAMAAHHQTYQFQVDIHALWGNLLGAFAAFRFLTYFFLFLRPPSSILPSRPPTEALASLALTCGGVVFISSVEQVTFAAMRHGADDVMAFLNITVAVVCAWFFWTACLFALKGWALSRSARSLPSESASTIKFATSP